MAGIDSVIALVIAATTRTASVPSFGTALLMSQYVPAGWGTARVKTATKLTDVAAMGFVPADVTYQSALKYFAQEPAPQKLKIGRRANKCVQTIKLTVTDVTEGKVYAFTVDGVAVTYTVLASATPTTVAVALAALITGTTHSVAVALAAGVMTLTAASGVVYDVSGWYACGLTLANTTADPGIVADVTACQVADPDFYGVALDIGGKATDVALAAWIETQPLLAVLDTSDTALADTGSTTDEGYTLKGSAYTRTPLVAGSESLLHRSGIATLGSRLAVQPGSDTWKFKTLKGVTPSTYSAPDIDAMTAKNVNTYTTILGIAVLAEGVGPAGNFMDMVRGLDWLKAVIKAAVFTPLANLPKVPYTDPGVSLIEGVILGVLLRATKPGVDLLAADPAPTVAAPFVADVDPVLKAQRILPDVTFTATGAGALHGLRINGTVKP